MLGLGIGVTRIAGGAAAVIPGSPVGWWDATDSSSITLVSTKVSQWNDKTGNGNHFTQSTDSVRPTQSTINSLNAIDFTDGPWMESAVSQANPFTIYAVVSFDAFSGTHNYICDGQDASNMAGIYQNVSLGKVVYNAGSAKAGLATISTSTTYVITAVFSASGNANCRINGVSDNVTLAGTQGPNNGLFLGRDYAATAAKALDAKIGEFAIYSGEHSGTTITDIEAYLTDKWT